MSKRALILGTGQAQADMIQVFAERGVYVCACSYISGDAGERYADEFRQINITDENAVYDYVIERGIDCIYSAGSDIAMPTVAAVARRAGLKSFVSEETARACNTKHLLRAKLGEGFAGNVRFQELSSPEEELKLGFPIVIKPPDSQGQRGVFKVNDAAELRERFGDSIKHSRMGKVIAEEYVDGPEISVNTFSVDGEIVFSLVSDRIVWDEYPGGIIHRHIVPSVLQDDAQVMAVIDALVRDVQHKLGIADGPAYFQIKVAQGGKPKLIEVTPRLDGCHMWRLISKSTGIDLLKLTIDLLLNGAVDSIGSWQATPYETEFLCLPPGSVFDKALFESAGSEYLQWYYEDGDMVKRMNGYMEKCGYRIIAR